LAAPGRRRRDLALALPIGAAGLGLFALYLATLSDEFFDVALFAYTLYGCGITPVVLAAYFWRRANQPGAVASMLSGAGVAVLWYNITQEDFLVVDGVDREGLLASIGGWGADHGIDAVIPALLIALPVLVVVSLMTEAPDEAHRSAI